MENKELKECVLVVPRGVIDPFCRQVFTRQTEPVRAAVLANSRFLERTIAEHDFSHKQIIPYVVVRHRDQYLLTRRTARQTEARLHDKYSLGVGGHINDSDVSNDTGAIILAGMRRELEEEIRLESEQSCTLVGVINDDSTEVARVHLGFVFLLTTASPNYTIVEHDKYTAMWKTPAECAPYYPQMESWAQIAHDYVLFDGAADRVKQWETRSSLPG